MIKPEFQDNETYLPVTMQQFESLTNEMLTEFNKLTTPHGLDGNYMAEIVHGVIHALPRTSGVINKTDLFNSCINLVSKHVTYHATEAIRARMEAEAKAAVESNKEVAPATPPAPSLSLVTE